MSERAQWLFEIEDSSASMVDGLVLVKGYARDGRPPDEVAMMEIAAKYGAHSVFFEAGRNGRSPTAQAFVFVSQSASDDEHFAELHKRLWSWGGVPLVYRKTPGLIQLFRCAHKPDFASADGKPVCRPIKTLKAASSIAARDAWWDSDRLRNGTIWDDPATCKTMMSATKAAHKGLIDAVKSLNDDLNAEGILKKHLRRKLLILSLLIAYLEERGVFLPGYFGQFLKGATKFFEVLTDGKALVKLLADLEERFNGHVFVLEDADQETLKSSQQLPRFARLLEARQEANGQLTLWQLYSFRDLPVELISHIYQLFVTDSDSSVYTPPILVRLMLEEALSWERLDYLIESDQIILDPACGSGVFLVEAYKRLVLHWRSQNNWKKPRTRELRRLLTKVHGIDLEQGAVELAAFSLCLAMCDALEPEEIRTSIKLFPRLAGSTLHHSCFFEAKERSLVKKAVGVVVGNPPFESNLSTDGARRSYNKYENTLGALPDKQLAYLFLHESMEMIAPGGILSMLQQYNLLYNLQSLGFRERFMRKWDVREILDFVSVRGLFSKGGADTKVVVVVADAADPKPNRKILHAVFRRSGRADAEQGFDIDYYDLHWLSREVILSNDAIWRADLLGGGRVLDFISRIRKYRTLGAFAEAQNWDFGEGFIEGQRGVSKPADHITGKHLLPSDALTEGGVDRSRITTALRKPIEGQRSAKRFTPPMLLIREQMNLPHFLWTETYLTYKNQIVGFAAPKSQEHLLRRLDKWLTSEASALRAFTAGVSVKLFTQKATTLSAADILALPYPEDVDLDLSPNEQIIVDDIVEYQRELVRRGEKSDAMTLTAHDKLPDFNTAYVRQISEVYKRKPLKVLPAQCWPGVICQPYSFGEGEIDWTGADSLRGKLDALLKQRDHQTLQVTRIARIYDGNFIFLLKPDSLRFWLRSIALRDADETMSDLRMQGF